MGGSTLAGGELAELVELAGRASGRRSTAAGVRAFGVVGVVVVVCVFGGGVGLGVLGVCVSGVVVGCVWWWGWPAGGGV